MSIANTFWLEVMARLTAGPTFGIEVESIKRKHRTVVTREKSPAIHVIEGPARPTEDKRCDWQWEMKGTIAVYVRDDDGQEAADAFISEIVDRIKPTSGTGYANKVQVAIESIVPDTEIADGDAVEVDINISIRFGTRAWSLDTPG